jgi:hypothetical protein
MRCLFNGIGEGGLVGIRRGVRHVCGGGEGSWRCGWRCVCLWNVVQTSLRKSVQLHKASGREKVIFRLLLKRRQCVEESCNRRIFDRRCTFHLIAVDAIEQRNIGRARMVVGGDKF